MTIPEALEIAIQHHRAGRLGEAEALYRQILAAQPDHADALHLLGVVAHQVGRHEAAVEWIRRAITLHPENHVAHYNLGEACRAAGKPEEAVAAYERALQLQSDYAQAHNGLGNALQERGQLAEAEAEYRRALALKPDFPEAHNNLGNALRERGQFDEAIAAYRRALALKSDFPAAHNNLGNAFTERGQLDEAVAACRRALTLQPDFPEAQNNLGNALLEQGQLDEAVAAYHRALALEPGLPEAHGNLGNALRKQGQFDEAIAAYRRALALKPRSPDAYNNLGSALIGQGAIDEAIAAFREALRLDPGCAMARSNLLYTLHFQPDHDDKTIAEERRRWNRQFGAPAKRSALPQVSDRGAGRRLRVGYVSPDFRDHVVGRNLIPLFARHDPREFEVFCYSGVTHPDTLTGQFRQRAHVWRSTLGVPDEALAAMIRQDGVDILVDLTQHMAENRLPVFARQPAPVQVSFAGYPESTGSEAVDHRISDRFLEPASVAARAEEPEEVHLIESFWCYDPCGAETEVNALPAGENAAVTFGCLNNFCKINEPVLKLWARVLGKVRDSRLVISSPVGSHRPRTLEILEKEGVEADRVEFVAPRPRREYLELYHRLDIALDTFPYNGHTTSVDALWMGVPVVSLVGNTPVSRAGLSQLTNLGLPELIAHSETAYVAIAASLARDLPRLASLRSTLRDRMENSVLMDAPRFARNIETAYRAMWERMKVEG